MEIKVNLQRVCCFFSELEGLRAEREDNSESCKEKWKEPLLGKKIYVVKISVGKYQVEC